MDDIFEAIASGDAGLVRRILESSPRLARKPDPEGVTPVLYALYRGQSEIVELIRQRADALSIWEAAAIGDLTRVRAAVEADPGSIDTPSPDGFTALQLAAFFSRPEVADFLLEQGADPNTEARNPSGIRAIHAACAGRNLAIVERLLAAGADATVAQEGGFTPLHEAAATGSAELVEMLVAAGAGAAALSTAGQTPADLARERGFEAVAEALEARVAARST